MPKTAMSHFICSHCQATLPLSPPRWRCDCGAYLDLEHTFLFPSDDDLRQRPLSIWRYREAFPLPDGPPVTLGEGWTPIVEGNIDGSALQFKLEYLSPSGSFKDRGASVLVSYLKASRLKECIEDSSGNAGAALATYATRAGIRVTVLVPDYASGPKLLQIQRLGARVETIPGSREKVERETLRRAETTFYASHAWQPFFLQGMRTLAYEIAEQRGWDVPERIVAPVASGSIVLGLVEGFRDLRETGRIASTPIVYGVQAEACAPLAEDGTIPEGKVESQADGILVPNPLRKEQIQAAVKETGGDILIVGEEEITDALKRLHSTGLYVEPTSAVPLAATLHHFQSSDRSENLLIPLSGSGLKRG